MDENTTTAAQPEPARGGRVDVIIGIAAIVLLLIPMFAFYWYFINQAIAHWVPLHNRLMAASGYGASWGMRFSFASWKVMSWLSPVIIICLLAVGLILMRGARWKQFSEQQRASYSIIFSIAWQVLFLYFIIVSIGLIMGWGELVLSLPVN
ncbi:MAG: hypothetical protein QME74_06910 [Candidatus Edwardsbacteria bacterium]|nr:hypothetical protein [Candidatus Edwardsbacteria bacterium]